MRSTSTLNFYHTASIKLDFALKNDVRIRSALLRVTPRRRTSIIYSLVSVHTSLFLSKLWECTD